MKFWIAIAVLALAVPVLAQRGGAHSGSSGGRGFAGHSGFSGGQGFSRPGIFGFSRPGSFVRPSPPISYGASGSARWRGIGPQNYAGRSIHAYGNRFMAPSSAYRATGARQSDDWNRDWNRNRDLFDRRRRSFDNWYVYSYPTWPGYGYSYVFDPGFYDWDDSDAAPDGTAYNQSEPAPSYAAPYADDSYGAPGETAQEGFPGTMPPARARGPQWGVAEPIARTAPVTEQSLTVIFKTGRAPVKMQNYMMTGKVLTDLDSGHYEQIPVDQIDIAATQWASGDAGVRFEIPGASRE